MSTKTILIIAKIVTALFIFSAIAIIVYENLLPVSSNQKLVATITAIDPETGEFTAVTDYGLDSPFLGAKKEPMKEFRCLRNTCTVQEDLRLKVGDRVETIVKSKATPSLNGAWAVEFTIASATKL